MLMMRGIFAQARTPRASQDRASARGFTQGRADGAKLDASALAPEDMFRKVLSLERKRSVRSGQRFVLVLLHLGKGFWREERGAVLEPLTKALLLATRETDLLGWYNHDKQLGVICTEIGSGRMNSILSTLEARIGSTLRGHLNLEQMNAIHLSFHVFPDELDLENGGRPADKSLYPDLYPTSISAKSAHTIKRSIDIVGSVFALALLSPFLILVAVAIKLTSKGPILFRQQRLGQYGARFTFLKFRSMYYQSDPKIHQNYVRQFISGKHDLTPAGGHNGVFKIQDDPRITPVGRFLRRTSLDELPQFLNVLKGEMSLVGPRPPIPYEIETYELWHRRRFLEVKPGITGLWQIEGRSRTKFDDMVRLDLQYARTWSPWLDIKILLRTPTAVLRGDGAY
jgi:lipopolysaccharide/colanic/teichoic acid biosynthesis glycosyltransferase